MTSASSIAAFLDLDGTLLTANSGALWLRRERRLGRVSTRQVVEATIWIVAYRFHALDMERVTTKALTTIRGEREQTVQRWTEQWFEDEVVPHVAPGAWEALRWHRQRGHSLVLLTSSSPYEARVAGEHFGLDAAVSSTYEVGPDGRFTGQIVRPLCYGAGKVALAERHAAAHGLDLERSYFYSDSFSDLPMLRRVGHPRAVAPDLRLRLAARLRGWPILDWSRAGG